MRSRWNDSEPLASRRSSLDADWTIALPLQAMTRPASRRLVVGVAVLLLTAVYVLHIRDGMADLRSITGPESGVAGETLYQIAMATTCSSTCRHLLYVQLLSLPLEAGQVVRREFDVTLLRSLYAHARLRVSPRRSRWRRIMYLATVV